MSYCENCGCKSYNGRCTNCHEELYILDQYAELAGTEFELPLPADDSALMKAAAKAEAEINNNLTHAKK